MRPVAAIITAFALALTGTVAMAPAPALAATGTVSGVVFRDFNGNGVQDMGAALSGVATDDGIAGIVATAVQGAGTIVGSATTVADGTYTINTSAVADGTPVRVQFDRSSWPAGYEPSGTAGPATTNGTSVQFVETGDDNVNFALNVPEDYAQDAAPLGVAIQRTGSPLASEGGSAIAINGTAIAGLAYTQGATDLASTQTGFPGMMQLATFGEVGAVSSVIFQPSSNDMFAFAAVKRQSGLGTAGLGGIYRLTDVLDASGQLQTPTEVAPWLNLVDIGIDVGSIGTNTARGLSGMTTPSTDIEAFEKAGKVGVGGAVLSDDGTTLYFVNYFDKKLYAIDVSDGTPPAVGEFESWDLGLTLGEHPSAVTISRGTIYVGYVESGETAAGMQPGQSAKDAGMNAYVVAASLDASGAPGAWTEQVSVDLGYSGGARTKGTTLNQFIPDASYVLNQGSQWNSWTDVWDWGTGSVTNGGPDWQVYPQPMLSSLYVDEDGYLSMGFADRTALQGGVNNYAAIPGDIVKHSAVSGGDVLIAAPRLSGGFTLENDGLAGERQGVPIGQNTTIQGPGGEEFYFDINADGGITRDQGGPLQLHWEVLLGGLTGHPGTGEVVMSAFDPLREVLTSGLRWNSIDDGTGLAGYELTPKPATEGTTDLGSFEKGGGLGLVTLIAEAAPVEIGNRVWFDADQDGLQGADEPVMPGLVVELRDSDGVLITQTTTDANGEYFFRSDEHNFSTTGDYTVVFVKPDSGTVNLAGPNSTLFGALDWGDLSFTEQGAGAGTTDSNPNENGVAPVSLEGPGMNNHSIDAGFVADASFTIQKLIDGSGGLSSPAQTFTITVVAQDFRGTAMAIPQSSFTLSADQISLPVRVPVGSSVWVREADADTVKSFEITVNGAAHEGYVRLTGTSDAFAFVVTNTLYDPGVIAISKAVTGAYSLTSPQIAGAEFVVAYASAHGDGEIVLNAANDWMATTPALPHDTVVTLSEPRITGADPAVSFASPQWSVGDLGDGTAELTIGDGTTTDVTLTNDTTQLVGGFTVTKSVIDDEHGHVPADTEFTVEYSLDNGASWMTLAPVQSGATVPGPTDIPRGPTVLLREQTRPDIAGVDWSPPAFSGTGVVNNGDGTATLTVGAGVVSVLLQNAATLNHGRFSVTKDVSGPAESLLIGDPEFVLSYTTEAGDSGELRVTNGETSTSPLFAAGTEVTVTEIDPTPAWLPERASWSDPVLRIDGAIAEMPFTIAADETIAIVVENPTLVEPSVSIAKGDGDAATRTIVHEADTVPEGETFAPGETRDVVIQVTNTGPEPLRNVTLFDDNLSGAVMNNLVWQMPSGAKVSATFDQATGRWSAEWPATFAPGTTTWAVGQVIYGTATLTLDESLVPERAHQNRATVSAQGALSGEGVEASNDYNAFTGAIQVIKYDGERSDPVIGNAAEGWVTPEKPMLDIAQDANDEDTAMEYPVDTARAVRWVVTNTGDTWLTNLTLTDETQPLDGPAIGDDWTADLSAFGGESDYSFADSGPWAGLLPPGASFFAEGTLVLPEDATHADVVDVVGTVVVPAEDGDGRPTDQPALGPGDVPIVATNDVGEPFTVDDDDPFHAWTGAAPAVEIFKGDGDGSTIVHEADTMTDGAAYLPGETRTIVIVVENTGGEALDSVSLGDVTTSGAAIENLVWTLPNGDTLPATYTPDAGWHAGWGGPWLPGEKILGTATLTLQGQDVSHVNEVSVSAAGVGSGTAVQSTNTYNAFTGEIQIIKYDGRLPDPKVKDADGAWITPTKPLANATQDANEWDTAAAYAVGASNPVRWVVTNTGTTWMADILVSDTTMQGASIAEGWTAALTPVGGPANYSFANDGPWQGLLAPGASFFMQGTLTLDQELARHADNVDVVGTVIVPAVDGSGVPNGEPLIGPDGPVRAMIDDPNNPGQKIPFTVTDDDPFHAYTSAPPLPVTGAVVPVGMAMSALLMLTLGTLVLVYSRRKARLEL